MLNILGQKKEICLIIFFFLTSFGVPIIGEPNDAKKKWKSVKIQRLSSISNLQHLKIKANL